MFNMFIPNQGEAGHQSFITCVGYGSGAQTLSQLSKNSGILYSFNLSGFKRTNPSLKRTKVVSI